MFERLYPITTRVDDVVIRLEELLDADSVNEILTDGYYNEIKLAIRELRIVSDMTKEIENN